MSADLWIVIVGERSLAKCYGFFESHDAAVAWANANQYGPVERKIYPVNAVPPPSPGDSG